MKVLHVFLRATCAAFLLLAMLLGSVPRHAGAAASSPSIACPGVQRPLVTDTRIYQMPVLAEPTPRVPFRDPVFGSCLVRVTDRTKDVASGDSSRGLKNEYSRVQSFNADGSYILVRSVRATWYLYDARTLKPLRQLSFEGTDPRWDARDPSLLYTFNGTRLMSYNVRTSRQALVHDFAADFPGQQLSAVWTRYEGSPSRDGRYWGLMAEDKDWITTALLVYDQQTNRVIATRSLRGVVGSGPTKEPLDADNVTMSPLGRYLVADFSGHYCARGRLGTAAHPCGVMIFGRSLQTGRGLLQLTGHSDLTLDAQGREVMVYQDVNTDQISMIDLATGALTPLVSIDFSHTAIGMHFSGRALDRPGWVVVSTYNGGYRTAYTWMDNQVFLMELKKGGRIVRLAHDHTLYNEKQEQDYWAEPQASANQDLTRILFTSNWGRSGTEAVDMFMIQLPRNWPALLK